MEDREMTKTLTSKKQELEKELEAINSRIDMLDRKLLTVTELAKCVRAQEDEAKLERAERFLTRLFCEERENSSHQTPKKSNPKLTVVETA